jgi:hypothetical protein
VETNKTEVSTAALKGVDKAKFLNIYSSFFHIFASPKNAMRFQASTMEMTAVMTSVRLGLGAMAAVLALALNFSSAGAQQKAPDPAASKAAPAAKKAAAPKKAAKPKSACAGLAQDVCTANTACQWIKATKTKAGKDRKAYCRTAPKKKAAPAKAAAPKAPAAKKK